MPQLFTEAVIDGVCLRDALVDTGSAFSMLSSVLYDQLLSCPEICSFSKSAPDILGVGGASAEVRGYVDVPPQIAGIKIAHPLLVVTSLAFPLIGMDILQPHAAKMSLGHAAPLELSVHLCDVCLEKRTDPKPKYRSAPPIACVIEQTLLAAKSAVVVPVKLPCSHQQLSTVAIEPLNSTILILGCAACPAVCEPNTCTCRIAVVNPTDEPIELLAGFLIASVAAVRLATIHARTAVTNPRLSHECKLRKILHELKVDVLHNTAPYKQQLLALVAAYLDVFAECKSDVGTTNVAFHEIDTGDVRPLRKPVRRLPYGEMRVVVEFEIDKLVAADIARPSTSPWASPVVIV